MGRTLQLYQLQSIDSEIDKTNQELAGIAAKLGESEALKRAKNAVEIADKDLRKAQTAMKDLDLEVKSLTDKINNQEKKLYSGMVLNAKEAANLQDEVASLKRWHGQREESLLEAMLSVEEAEETLDQAQTALSELQAAWAAEQEQLKQTQNTLEAKRAELTERRPAVANSVDSGDLSNYEKLRSKKAGRAVAVVKDGVCQGCGMTPSNNKLQRARAGLELTYCGACGRILHVL